MLVKLLDLIRDRVTTKYACEVPFGDGSGGTFNADDWMEPKERRKVDDFISIWSFGCRASGQ